MDDFAALTLRNVSEKFFDAFVGKVADSVLAMLKGDPTGKAFQKALASAIQRYSTMGSRLDVARPLLDKDGLLAQQDVAAELSQILRFDREPDVQLIGRSWKAALDDPTLNWRDYPSEARLLIDYLKDELKATDVFRPVFEAKALDAIADRTAITAEAVVDAAAQLTNLRDLMDARFADLIRAVSGSSFNIRDQVRDFSRLINDKTRGFVGRQFVFDAVTKFIADNPQGYFIMRGDPGIGKSSLAAQLVRASGFVHHFNIRPEGINKADIFLKNICAQLIAVYGLNYDALPPEAGQDAGFLNRLLGEISDRGQKAVIVVDALDEADNAGLSAGVNPLCLPVSLPNGIYFVVTGRKETLDQRRVAIDLRIDCEQQTLFVEQDSAGNVADIHEYVTQSVDRPGITDYIHAQEIDDETFIDHVVEKSQGNFMYLHYVLPEIEKGVYRDLALDSLPVGLQSYYERHWNRMKGTGVEEEAWFKYKLPVVMALTVAKEAVSIDLLEHFSGVHERPRIRGVLQDWAQFLYVEKVPYEGGIQDRYRVYHYSFQEFIADKEEVADERVSKKEASKRIADTLWKDLFGDEEPA